MRINLRIDFIDGKSKEVTASAADLVRFEREFEISVSALEKETKFTHLLYLAWSSEFRRKETAKDFDDWIQDVEMVSAGEADPK
jgi:hypothetical protein